MVDTPPAIKPITRLLRPAGEVGVEAGGGEFEGESDVTDNDSGRPLAIKSLDKSLLATAAFKDDSNTAGDTSSVGTETV